MRNDNKKTPICYRCVHRGKIPGSVHICCQHPKAQALVKDQPILQLVALLGARAGGFNLGEKAMGVVGDPHGIAMGWFQFPLNFDPAWLLECAEFEERKTDGQTAE